MEDIPDDIVERFAEDLWNEDEALPEESPEADEDVTSSSKQNYPEKKRRIFRKKKEEQIPENVIEAFEAYMESEGASVAGTLSEEAPEDGSIDLMLPGGEQPRDILSAMRAALDESAGELAEIRAEPVMDEEDSPRSRKRFWKRNRYFTVGVLCTVLAGVGVVTCVVYGVRAVQQFAAGSSLSTKLETALYPVAVVDLAPFENVSEANAEGMLSAAVISMIMYEDLSEYPCSFDMLTVPAADVRAKAADMFGAEPAGEMTTLRAAGELFFYDEMSDSYNVPESPVIFSYSPSVQEIQRDGNGDYVVVVDYIGDVAGWQEKSGNAADQKKTMEITLHPVGDDYQFVRIRNVSEHGNGL